ETMKIVSGKILFWEDHYLRLMASIRILRIDIPQTFTIDFLENQVLENINRSFDKQQAVKARLTIYRYECVLYTPKDNTVSFLIACESIDAPFYLHATESYEIELFKDYYINSGLLSTIKSTNKASHILGGIYAKENEFNNCILLNENK